MTRQEALARLKPSLIDAIDAWWAAEQEKDDDTTLGVWVGEGCWVAMATAALAVLDGIGDAQEEMGDAIDYSKL